MKSRRLQCAGNRARVEETRNIYIILVGKSLKNIHLEDQREVRKLFFLLPKYGYYRF
jgi:hypothetical protein